MFYEYNTRKKLMKYSRNIALARQKCSTIVLTQEGSTRHIITLVKAGPVKEQGDLMGGDEILQVLRNVCGCALAVKSPFRSAGEQYGGPWSGTRPGHRGCQGNACQRHDNSCQEDLAGKHRGR